MADEKYLIGKLWDVCGWQFKEDSLLLMGPDCHDY